VDLVGSIDDSIAGFSARAAPLFPPFHVPPTASQAGSIASVDFSALALSVQETGSAQAAGSQAGSAGNVGSISPSAATTSASTTSAGAGLASTGSLSNVVSATTDEKQREYHGRHQFPATDEAVSDFELADVLA